MKITLAVFCLSLVLLINVGCYAQASKPSKQETFDFLKNKIAFYGYQMAKVETDSDKCTLTVYQDNTSSGKKGKTHHLKNAMAFDLKNYNADSMAWQPSRLQPQCIYLIFLNKDGSKSGIPFRVAALGSDEKIKQELSSAFSIAIGYCGGSNNR